MRSWLGAAPVQERSDDDVRLLGAMEHPHMCLWLGAAPVQGSSVSLFELGASLEPGGWGPLVRGVG
jgi:hypothetical protein